ncbi:MAG: hypothetical protein IPG39_05455 [Bacteroidetes bacterium]|nr:hypothetical protein [Bacteroidota bacterium]
MQIEGHEVIKNFRPGKIVLPVLIGIGVALYLLISNFDKEAYEKISWTWYTTFLDIAGSVHDGYQRCRLYVPY